MEAGLGNIFLIHLSDTSLMQRFYICIYLSKRNDRDGYVRFALHIAMKSLTTCEKVGFNM